MVWLEHRHVASLILLALIVCWLVAGCSASVFLGDWPPSSPTATDLPEVTVAAEAGQAPAQEAPPVAEDDPETGDAPEEAGLSEEGDAPQAIEEPTEGATESAATPETDSQDADGGEDTVALLNCPQVGDSLYLVFEHDVTFSAMGMTSINHSMAPQAVELRAIDTSGDDGRVLIENNYLVAPGALNVYISGSAGTCRVDGSAKLVPTITGYCEEGIVWLTIYEEWQAYEMLMACDDGPAMPFELPDTGYKHAGAGGQGLDFWLLEDGPAVREVPFQGAGGSGAHRWVLYADLLELPVDELSIERWE